MVGQQPMAQSVIDRFGPGQSGRNHRRSSCQHQWHKLIGDCRHFDYQCNPSDGGANDRGKEGGHPNEDIDDRVAKCRRRNQVEQSANRSTDRSPDYKQRREEPSRCPNGVRNRPEEPPDDQIGEDQEQRCRPDEKFLNQVVPGPNEVGEELTKQSHGTTDDGRSQQERNCLRPCKKVHEVDRRLAVCGTQ